LLLCLIHTFFVLANSLNIEKTKCTVRCIISVVEFLAVDLTDNEEHTLACEMDSEYEDGVPGIIYTIKGLSDLTNIDSGKTILYSEESICLLQPIPHSGGEIIVKEGGYDLLQPQFRMMDTSTSTIGTKPLLVVYCNAADYSNVARTSVELANDVFGICDGNGCIPDTANLSSQTAACSGGQWTYAAACSDPTDLCYGTSLITNGVITVNIPQNIGGVAVLTVGNYCGNAAFRDLSAEGINLNDFHQMYVFSTHANWGSSSALAFMPGTLSAFRDTYAYRLPTLVHEMGHNIGFGHSSFGTEEYGDKSCMMGAPGFGDDTPLVCFNGAKSWQSGWYQNDSVEVDVLAGEIFDGKIIGIDDYVKNQYTSGIHSVVLKIPDPSNPSSDYYVLFNRKKRS